LNFVKEENVVFFFHALDVVSIYRDIAPQISFPVGRFEILIGKDIIQKKNKGKKVADSSGAIR
jgi:hypothetical protein